MTRPPITGFSYRFAVAKSIARCGSPHAQLRQVAAASRLSSHQIGVPISLHAANRCQQSMIAEVGMSEART
jgi:hypothetical protein